MFVAEWYRYSECRSFPFNTLNRNITTMHFHEFVHEGQSDTTALMSSCLRVFDTIESFEHMRKILFADSDTGIAYDQLNMIMGFFYFDGDLSFESKLECVRDKVQHN